VELLKVNVHLTGTVQRNRKGLPRELSKKLKLKLHDVLAYATKTVMMLVWFDKCPVYMLTTYHDASTQTVQRRVKGGTESISKPTFILDYSPKMGAVARADHMCTSYSFSRMSIKWRHKTFYWLIEVSVVNSFILYDINQSQSGGKQISHLQYRYRKKLVEQLVGDVRNQKKKRGRPSSLDKSERLDKQQHWVGRLEGDKTKDCAVCSNRMVKCERKKTVFYCKTCSKNPGLHPVECFQRYHTLADYKMKPANA